MALAVVERSQKLAFRRESVTLGVGRVSEGLGADPVSMGSIMRSIMGSMALNSQQVGRREVMPCESTLTWGP